MTNAQLPDRRLLNLLDKDEIRELALRYCHHVRAGNVDAIVEQYSVDVEFELPVGLAEGLSDSHSGREAIRSPIATGLPIYQPWLFVHNHIIEILSEDRARGWLHSEIRMGKRNLETSMIVSYEDDYVKENGRWKFRFRKVKSTALKGPRTRRLAKK